MITYIYLTETDKNKLSKLAQHNMLSLSACVDIIATWYNYSIQLLPNYDKYINKGNKKIKLSISKKATWNISDKTATNCVYAYLHNEIYNNIKNKPNLKSINSKIQSQMATTYDQNYLKNIIIRTNYQQLKGKLN